MKTVVFAYHDMDALVLQSAGCWLRNQRHFYHTDIW